ncbi:VRR-NUC domain-containing protein [Marinimicrobium agarilyticum]|uniref:VRR-NUC domain-containing protein n=1 Tax=Marinimicrobium agarilyticum TaxID=306546 RepID=UPI000412A0A1|nr:VRR-NUC domain-containing protein [Marinimicrobium agarilyticum]
MSTPATTPETQGPASLDDPLYYRRNFEWVLEWVNGRYGDLLPDSERSFIETVMTLPEASRGLLVRMVMRKGDLFRPEALDYPELGDTAIAAESLLRLGWLNPQPLVTLDELFRLVTWARLKNALKPRLEETGLVTASLRKGEALEHLKAQALEPRPVEDWGLAEQTFWQLTVMPTCDRLRWLFFGNPYQDWSEFVLTELGLYQYEPVVFDESARPVHSRTELETYWQLLECQRQWQDEDAPEAILPQLPPEPTANPWLVRHYHRLLFKLARHWERVGELERARDLYEVCNYPGGRGRRLRVLERLEAFEPALALATQAQQSPESEAEAQQLERLIPRLRRKVFREKASRPRSTNTEQIALTLPSNGFVEQAVLEHLGTPEAPIYYAENTLLTGLFGLLCWEPIFQPLPGAFFHPFQRGPADLYWPDFYARRAEAFDACLAMLDDGRYIEQIWRHYREKWGRQSPFVFWGAMTEELLAVALECIPPEHLALCFRRLLRDVKANRAGLPDLVQFFPNTGEYRMIEVKGPGDRLQDNQKRWLAFFEQHRMPVAVCYVDWADPEEASDA